MAKKKFKKGRAIRATGVTGRNRSIKVEWDLAQVEDIVGHGGTLDDVAFYHQVSRTTVEKKMQAEPAFRALIEKSRLTMRRSLRMRQLEVATQGSGNPALLIFLGKQYLGQSDVVQEKRDDKPADDDDRVVVLGDRKYRF